MNALINLRVVLIGFGNVGQGFVSLLMDKERELADKHGLMLNVVGVATRSKGVLYHPAGLKLDLLLESAQRGTFEFYPDDGELITAYAVEDLIKNSDADVLVEVSPTNITDGQPSLDYCYLGLESGKHVVTVNKGPIALDCQGLEKRAEELGLKVLYEGTVMAGTPSIRLIQESLSGSQISRVRGILNGTTNYMLTQMHAGLSYEEALKQAQELGYAEPDPTADVEGWDVAAKVLILSSVVFGKTLKLDQLSVQGISGLTKTDIENAQKQGKCWKLIGEVTEEGGSVQPMLLDVTNPLASVGGATNAINVDTDVLGEVTLIGAGAGRIETGYAILADLLALHRLKV